MCGSQNHFTGALLLRLPHSVSWDLPVKRVANPSFCSSTSSSHTKAHSSPLLPFRVSTRSSHLKVGLAPCWGFSDGSAVQNPPANAGDTGDMGSIPWKHRLGRSPGEGKCQPTPVFLPEKSHGQRSLVGYNPKGCKESDTTDELGMHCHGTRLSADQHPFI